MCLRKIRRRLILLWYICWIHILRGSQISTSMFFYSIHGDVENVYPIADSSNPILKMDFITLNDYFMILWSGSLDDTRMQLVTVEDGVELTPLNFHGLVPIPYLPHGFAYKLIIHDCSSALVIASTRTKLYTCVESHENAMVEMNLVDGEWQVNRVYDTNTDKLIQLEFSQEEQYVVGTFMMGYKVLRVFYRSLQ